jgi:hypothetical protein
MDLEGSSPPETLNPSYCCLDGAKGEEIGRW